MFGLIFLFIFLTAVIAVMITGCMIDSVIYPHEVVVIDNKYKYYPPEEIKYRRNAYYKFDNKKNYIKKRFCGYVLYASYMSKFGIKDGNKLYGAYFNVSKDDPMKAQDKIVVLSMKYRDLYGPIMNRFNYIYRKCIGNIDARLNKETNEIGISTNFELPKELTQEDFKILVEDALKDPAKYPEQSMIATVYVDCDGEYIFEVFQTHKIVSIIDYIKSE